MEQILIDWEGPVLLWIQEHMRNDFSRRYSRSHTSGRPRLFLDCADDSVPSAEKTRKVGGLMTCSLLLNTLVNNVPLKNLVARTRPYEVVDGLHRIIEAQSDYSLPDILEAHLRVAVVVFLCVRGRSAPVLAFAFVIAFSRLYVGVHFRRTYWEER